MRFYGLLTVLCFVLGLSACSSIGHKFDEERAKRVQKVVVLSFEIQQDQPRDSLGFTKFTELKEGRLGDSAEFQNMAQQIYTDLLSQIERKTGWKGVGVAALAADKNYQEKVIASTTGLHQVSMTGNSSVELINVKTVLNNIAYRKMSFDEKAKMAREVGADAFADFVLYESIDQGSGLSIGNLTGNTPFMFTARSNLTVYGLDNEDPLWRIQNVDGAKTLRSDSLPPEMGRVARLAKLGKEAAVSSIKTAVSDYAKN